MNISYIDNKIYILLHSTSSFGSQKGKERLIYRLGYADFGAIGL
jgi:hypothetical protein